MKALVIEKPGASGVREKADPTPAPGWVTIRVMACGVCGTDLHIYQGEYLGGYPITPGHELAGVIEAVGPEVTRFSVGERVAVEPNIPCNNCEACLNNRQNFCENWRAVGVTLPGGMAELVACPESALFSIGELPFEQGAFMEPLSCVVHGVERARFRIGDRVALFGAGPIGIMMLRLLLLQGVTDVTVVEQNSHRLAIARASGAARCLSSTEELKVDFYDVVADATGAPALEERAPGFARPGGTVLLFGVPPAGKSIQLEPFAFFHKGLTILSSYTSLRNSYQAVSLIASGRLPVADLVTHRLPLERFAEGIEAIRSGKEVMKVMMLPNGQPG